MCFDIKFVIASQLKREKRLQNFKSSYTYDKGIKQDQANVKDFYHVSAFTHPQIFIFTNQNPNIAIPATWGLIPNWVKDNKQRIQLWNKTLNARGETIFEKPSFRFAAKHNRCLIYIDGFYEHHHFKGKTYPFFIFRKDGEPIAVAGLWSEWTDKESGEIWNSFTIVTTRANSLMSKIHNNPKLHESRMPVIIENMWEDTWLSQTLKKEELEDIKKLIKPCSDEKLAAHTVHRLRGKEALGNIPKASEEFEYNELQFAS